MNNKQAIASCKAEATKDTEGINKGEEIMPSPQQVTLLTGVAPIK